MISITPTALVFSPDCRATWLITSKVHSIVPLLLFKENCAVIQVHHSSLWRFPSLLLLFMGMFHLFIWVICWARSFMGMIDLWVVSSLFFCCYMSREMFQGLHYHQKQVWEKSPWYFNWTPSLSYNPLVFQRSSSWQPSFFFFFFFFYCYEFFS